MLQRACMGERPVISGSEAGPARGPAAVRVTGAGVVRIGFGRARLARARPGCVTPGAGVSARLGASGAIRARVGLGRRRGRRAPGTSPWWCCGSRRRAARRTASRPETSRRRPSRGTSIRAPDGERRCPRACAPSGTSTPSSRCRCSATRRCRAGACLPFRPPVVMPLGPGRARRPHAAARAAAVVPRAGDRGAGREGAGRRRPARRLARRHRPRRRRVRDRARGHRGRRRARLLRAVGRLLRVGVGRRRRRCATPTCSGPDSRTGPTTAAPTGTGPSPGSTRRRRSSRRSTTSKRAACRWARCSSTRGGTRTRCCARSTPTSGSSRRPAWCAGSRAPTCCPTASRCCASASTGARSWRTAATSRRSRRTATSSRCGSTATARIPQGGELYERLLDQAVAWGVEVFEHDWLIECFLGVRELRAPGRAAAWQEGIDAAPRRARTCTRSGAWRRRPTSRRRAACATSRRSARAATTVTWSAPRCLWAWFLHTNVMARALGLWPYKDVFHSARGLRRRARSRRCSRRCRRARSASAIAIGAADVELIRRTCRADGVLVRPDVPVAAIDRARRSTRRSGRARCSSAARTRSTRPAAGATW